MLETRRSKTPGHLCGENDKMRVIAIGVLRVYGRH